MEGEEVNLQLNLDYHIAFVSHRPSYSLVFFIYSYFIHNPRFINMQNICYTFNIRFNSCVSDLSHTGTMFPEYTDNLSIRTHCKLRTITAIALRLQDDDNTVYLRCSYHGDHIICDVRGQHQVA
jgi:hypothetical protein